MAQGRIGILDGWRALSITLVLAGHLFPVGPKSWALNGAIAASGMALFFTLSGFLITQFLLKRPDVIDFLLRRLFRIVPLAWVAMTILALADRADAGTILANLLFVSNLPPSHLMGSGEHLWSLCVEMQFYAGVAALVAIAGRKGLYALPFFCVAITLARTTTSTPISIVTWFRADEILAGACVALIYANTRIGEWLKRLPSMTPLVLLVLLVAAGHEAAGPFNYFRPYLAAAAVGSSLFSAPAAMRSLFSSKVAVYVADTSYALYVIHGMLAGSWLGTGDILTKYAKRPFLLLGTFAIAHASTFWFERPMIALGKAVGRRLKSNSVAAKI